MRLIVTGRYVDLDFQTTPPLKLSCQFANDSVARSAARAMAIILRVEEFDVTSNGVTNRESVRAGIGVTSFRKRQRRVHAIARKRSR